MKPLCTLPTPACGCGPLRITLITASPPPIIRVRVLTQTLCMFRGMPPASERAGAVSALPGSHALSALSSRALDSPLTAVHAEDGCDEALNVLKLFTKLPAGSL